jgi:beta-glucosidase/6-phospho-beta-glucosidase/beta-galactosidase
VKLMAEMGLEAYRFSISWSRLIPGTHKKHIDCICIIVKCFKSNLYTILETSYETLMSFSYFYCIGGTGDVNPAGLEYYNNLINELLKHGRLKRKHN